MGTQNNDKKDALAERCEFYEDKIQEFVKFMREKIEQIEWRLHNLEQYTDIEFENKKLQKKIAEDFETIRWIIQYECTCKEVETEAFIEEWSRLLGYLRG